MKKEREVRARSLAITALTQERNPGKRGPDCKGEKKWLGVVREGKRGACITTKNSEGRPATTTRFFTGGRKLHWQRDQVQPNSPLPEPCSTSGKEKGNREDTSPIFPLFGKQKRVKRGHREVISPWKKPKLSATEKEISKKVRG